MNKRLLLIVKDDNEVVPSSDKTHYIFVDAIDKLEVTSSTACAYILYILRVNDERIYFTNKEKCERMLQKILKRMESHFNIVDLDCEEGEVE